MRKWYFLAGIMAVGVGLIGWATWAVAQPVAPPPPDDVQPLVLPQGEPIGRPLTGLKIPMGEPLKLPEGRSSEPTILMPIKSSKPLIVPSISEKPIISEPIKFDPVVSPLTSPMTLPMAVPMTITEKVETPVKSGVTELVVNPTGKQEPSVTLEWLGPAAVKVGQSTDYSINVRNTSATPVQKVMVQVRMPSGVNVVSMEPKADNADNVLLWDLGTLLARQEKRLQMKVVSPNRGEMNCQAWVTFTGSSIMKMQVREPKLLVKAEGPTGKVLVGDPATVMLTVSNPGDHPAELVKITANLGDGLESARGNKLAYDLGTIAPGETRTLQVPCMTKTGGEQKCEVFVEGADGLKANDSVLVSVIQPKLELDVAGPKLRYKDRKATYSLKLTNPGDAPAGNVFLTDVLPTGMKFVSSDSGGQHDFATRSVKWFIGEIAPGQSKEVKVEVIADTIGEQVHKIAAVAARGMKVEKDCVTQVEGLSAILMELVDLDDPIEVGGDSTYEIKITNTGSKTETDLKLVCTIPIQLEFKSAQGPVQFDQIGTEVVFQPLSKLAPRADVIFKVVCKAKVKGDARFKAQLTTTSLVEPVVKVESTRVYED